MFSCKVFNASKPITLLLFLIVIVQIQKDTKYWKFNCDPKSCDSMSPYLFVI